MKATKRRMLSSEPTFTPLNPKSQVVVVEKILDKDGNVTSLKQTIKTDYLVNRSFKPSDFKLSSIIDAGAYQLLKPSSLGAPSDALDFIDDMVSRIDVK